MVKQILYYHPKKKQIREVIALCGLRVFKFYTVLPSELANTTYACQKCLDLVPGKKHIGSSSRKKIHSKVSNILSHPIFAVKLKGV